MKGGQAGFSNQKTQDPGPQPVRHFDQGPRIPVPTLRAVPLAGSRRFGTSWQGSQGAKPCPPLRAIGTRHHTRGQTNNL